MTHTDAKKWKNLSKSEKCELLLAWHDGESDRIKCVYNGELCQVGEFGGAFDGETVYLLTEKKEPVFEQVLVEVSTQETIVDGVKFKNKVTRYNTENPTHIYTMKDGIVHSITQIKDGTK